MNASDIFDSFLILSYYMLAIIILTAVAGIIESFMNPRCKCHIIARQKQENKGVKL